MESGEGKNVTLTFLLKDLKNEDKNFILDIICKSANDHNAIDNITLHLNFLFNDQNENRENDSDMFTLFLYSALLIVVIAILFIFFKLKKSKDRL